MLQTKDLSRIHQATIPIDRLSGWQRGVNTVRWIAIVAVERGRRQTDTFSSNQGQNVFWRRVHEVRSKARFILFSPEVSGAKFTSNHLLIHAGTNLARAFIGKQGSVCPAASQSCPACDAAFLFNRLADRRNQPVNIKYLCLSRRLQAEFPQRRRRNRPDAG